MDDLSELQRFAELGRLSASLLHEISNPLTAALLNLEQSDQTVAVRRARHDMLLLSRYVEAARQQLRSDSSLTSFAPVPQIYQLKRLLLPLARRAGVRLKFGRLPSGTKLFGDSVKFQQLLANLIINAIQAYDPRPTDKLAGLVRVNFQQRRGWLSIEVADWGRGIAAGQLTRLYEPFYTTKPASKDGLGIGLSIVKGYVSDFGGSIKVNSYGQRGTRFVINLPISSPRPVRKVTA